MRPTILDPLFAPISSLKGIGPKVAERLTRLIGVEVKGAQEATIWGLLKHIPVDLVDRRLKTPVADAPHGAVVTLDVIVDRHEPSTRQSRQPYRVFAFDASGEVILIFFHAHADYLQKTLPEGKRRLISGQMEWFNARPQIVHPDYIVDPDGDETLPTLEPVYPMTRGLSPKTFRKALDAALSRLPVLPEWQSISIAERHQFPTWVDALRTLHKPDDPSALGADSSAVRRLAYDELLAAQLAIGLVRARHAAKKKDRVRTGDGRLTAKIEAAVPFSLTRSQRKAMDEIRHDLGEPKAMLRLLQGDVGSGKTIIALLTMAIAVEAGEQAVLMAPTDLLARQHADSLAGLCEKAGLSLAVLTGRDKASVKSAVRQKIDAGEVDIVVGTHALFQEGVSFKALGVIVIDEQHRFGVHQRLALARLGDAPDMLVMTATPIPRTLILSIYGDMATSSLTDKPAGRQPIDTRSASLDRLDEVVDRIANAITRGEKVYWVCPLVETSDKLELTAAEDRYEALKLVMGERVELIHGRMMAAQKDAAMLRFRDGDASVLVATTVIEVGVDVPDASIIVIEHAERFGLAQLHQLRGRVGRGSKKSSCLLLYRAPLGATAKARLSILRESQDGFRLAEEDLRLRGEGEVLGTRQSGLPGHAFADLEVHADLLELARDEARYLVARDPDLADARGEALRVLLYLFGQDQAFRTLRAG